MGCSSTTVVSTLGLGLREFQAVVVRGSGVSEVETAMVLVVCGDGFVVA
jgi:hypothetical protein